MELTATCEHRFTDWRPRLAADLKTAEIERRCWRCGHYETRRVPVVISQTGIIHGRGSMPHRWVSGLTKSERAGIRDGQHVVLVPDDHPRSRCEYKLVTMYHGHYYHRNAPSESEDAALEQKRLDDDENRLLDEQNEGRE
jgi:hypothetical protein